jgi:hypothetical protein
VLFSRVIDRFVERAGLAAGAAALGAWATVARSHQFGVGVSRKKIGISSSRFSRALQLCALLLALLLQSHELASAAEVRFDPKTCKQSSGNVYVALGRYVFVMSNEDQNKYVFQTLNETSLILKAPEPSEPVGCLGNPLQLLSHRIANRLFSALSGQSLAAGPAPDVLTLYRLDRSPLAEPDGKEWPGESSQLDFAAHFFDGGNCREGLVQEDIANQLTACRMKLANPQNARQEDWATSYQAKVYAAPLGKPFVINCDAMLFSDHMGSCRVGYVLKPGLGVSYKFQPYRGRSAIPIERIVDFDRSLRALIENELVKDYPWPPEGQVESRRGQ